MRASATVSEGERRLAIIKELRVPHELYPSWRRMSINDLRVGSDAPDGCLSLSGNHLHESRTTRSFEFRASLKELKRPKGRCRSCYPHPRAYPGTLLSSFPVESRRGAWGSSPKTPTNLDRFAHVSWILVDSAIAYRVTPRRSRSCRETKAFRSSVTDPPHD